MPSLLRVQSTRVQQPHCEGTSSFVHSGPWEAQHKVQPVQFVVKGKVGMSTSVVRGCLEEVLSQVIGTDGLDVYATMNGKILDLCSTLLSCGITDGCTVHVHFRLRGGSREDVPGQWTCSQCFAPRCWPVRKRCYRCGAARDDLPVSSEGKGMGKWTLQSGHLVENRHKLQGMCRPQHVGHKSCLLGVRLVQGLGVLLPLNLRLRLHLKSWSRHSSSFRAS